MRMVTKFANQAAKECEQRQFGKITKIVDWMKKLKDSKTKDESDETVKKISDVLDTKIRPAEATDGGDINFKSLPIPRIEIKNVETELNEISR